MWLTESLFVRGSVLVLASTATASGPSSCSEEKQTPTSLESVELLDLLEAQNKRHDPKNYVEVDLGKYKVTHVLEHEAGYLLVEFHLFAVLPKSKQEEFAHSLPLFEQRVRGAVIDLIQHSETEQLTAPSLEYLKAELVLAINRTLQANVLKDVAFSNFAIDRT